MTFNGVLDDVLLRRHDVSRLSKDDGRPGYLCVGFLRRGFDRRRVGIRVDGVLEGSLDESMACRRSHVSNRDGRRRSWLRIRFVDDTWRREVASDSVPIACLPKAHLPDLAPSLLERNFSSTMSFLLNTIEPISNQFFP